MRRSSRVSPLQTPQASSRNRLVRRPRDRRQGGDERQRLRVQKPPLRRHADRNATTPSPDQTTAATDKREGRTTDPDTPQRVGLHPHLRELPGTHRSPPPLPRAIQLPKTTRQPQPPATGLTSEQPR